jgi:hypothetical protein
MSSTNASVVLTLREIRNLLAIAEREADLRAPDSFSREDAIVIVNGTANPGENPGETHVALRTAGYANGEFTLWSRRRVDFHSRALERGRFAPEPLTR